MSFFQHGTKAASSVIWLDEVGKNGTGHIDVDIINYLINNHH